MPPVTLPALGSPPSPPVIRDAPSLGPPHWRKDRGHALSDRPFLTDVPFLTRGRTAAAAQSRDRPGLAVELDEAKVGRHRVRSPASVTRS
jgi:hypothetical protein